MRKINFWVWKKVATNISEGGEITERSFKIILNGL